MFELEPFDALALSLHHSPGVYALLVGSGLSRAAGIPTGWEITIDLIRRLGTIDGLTEDDSWEAWFRRKYEKEPNYSEILDALGGTASERRSILHDYIEPKPGEDARHPTKAHHAIAKLVADGVLRVIITTNFDRLIENALREAGIEPTVIASEDGLIGATPLVHARCTVIKLHGDYLDARIKNTEDELNKYPSAINGMLDEVFDRFGLLVVGWSGEWDTALRAALLRVPNRRYLLYWATRGQIAPLAHDIIAHRSGRSFPITDADSFFVRLSEMVAALRQASRPHPQSVAMAIVLAKRYCRDDRYALEWAEFVAAEVDKIRAFVTGKNYPKGMPAADSLDALVTSFTSQSETLRRACLVCGRWGTNEALRTAAQAIRALGFRSEITAGYQHWNDLRDFGASICFYWALVGSIARADFAATRLLMHTPMRTDRGEEASVSVLPITRLISLEWKFLKGLATHKTPASDFLLTQLKIETVDASVDSREIDDLFDFVEILISLEYTHILLNADGNNHGFFLPFGRFIWKQSGRRMLNLLAEFDGLTHDHPLLQAGLVEGTPELTRKAVEAVRQRFANMW